MSYFFRDVANYTYNSDSCSRSGLPSIRILVYFTELVFYLSNRNFVQLVELGCDSSDFGMGERPYRRILSNSRQRVESSEKGVYCTVSRGFRQGKDIKGQHGNGGCRLVDDGPVFVRGYKQTWEESVWKRVEYGARARARARAG